MMNTLTIDVRSLLDTLAETAQAIENLMPSEPRISFDSPELLWKILTAKRWEILKVMTGAGPLALREIASMVNRDFKSVHMDVHALLDAGIIDRDTKRFIIPYDAVHVDFLLKAGLLGINPNGRNVSLPEDHLFINHFSHREDFP